jgi:hypothetical protein
MSWRVHHFISRSSSLSLTTATAMSRSGALDRAYSRARNTPGCTPDGNDDRMGAERRPPALRRLQNGADAVVVTPDRMQPKDQGREDDRRNPAPGVDMDTTRASEPPRRALNPTFDAGSEPWIVNG